MIKAQKFVGSFQNNNTTYSMLSLNISFDLFVNTKILFLCFLLSVLLIILLSEKVLFISAKIIIGSGVALVTYKSNNYVSSFAVMFLLLFLLAIIFLAMKWQLIVFIQGVYRSGKTWN
uniref:Uncharacterized protein n=1 Tax=Cacopsylla melanoneura TaxID=428564 RepID=A0A8D9FA70_9HEMI